MKIPALKDLLRMLYFEKNSTQITIKDKSEPFEVFGTPRTVPYVPLATYLNSKVIKVSDYPVGDTAVGLEIQVPDNITYDFEYKNYCPDLEWVLSTFDLKLFDIRIDVDDGQTVTNVYSGKYSEIEYFAVADILTGHVYSFDTDSSDLEGNNILTVSVRKPSYIVYNRSSRQ